MAVYKGRAWKVYFAGLLVAHGDQAQILDTDIPASLGTAALFACRPCLKPIKKKNIILKNPPLKSII